MRGQNSFSHVDRIATDPPLYLDTSPLPPGELLRARVPLPQILLSGDGMTYPGFLRSLSVADMSGFDWMKLIGSTSLIILPSFAPFQDDGPFLSHKTVVKQVVNVLREAKKQNKKTHVWMAYSSRTNVADVELATILDRRIDLIPVLNFLHLSVVCPVIHLAIRNATTFAIEDSTTPHDMPLMFLQLTSQQLPAKQQPRVVEFYPRACDPHVSVDGTMQAIFCPTSTMFQLRIDLPQEITREVDGVETKWTVNGSLPLMLLINGLSPDDSSTVLKNPTAPRITKAHWPVSVNAALDGFKIFDFHIPMDVMARFYEEQPALQDLDINIALLHSSVKNACIIVTHQPPFRANAPRRKKMPANEIRDAINIHPHLRQKFEFITFLNKYDVMCMIKDDLLMQPAIQELEGMGDLLVISATSHQRIRAKDVVRAVQPPYTLV